MYLVYQEADGYIQGKLIRKCKTKKAALNAAKKIKGFYQLTKDKDGLWIENEDLIPIGIIIIKEQNQNEKDS